LSLLWASGLLFETHCLRNSTDIYELSTKANPCMGASRVKFQILKSCNHLCFREEATWQSVISKSLTIIRSYQLQEALKRVASSYLRWGFSFNIGTIQPSQTRQNHLSMSVWHWEDTFNILELLYYFYCSH